MKTIKKIIALSAMALLTAGPVLAQSETYKAYKGKSNFIHKIIYLDLDGVFEPIKATDYFVWGIFLAGIALMISVMLMLVKVKEITTAEPILITEPGRTRTVLPKESVDGYISGEQRELLAS